MSTPLARAVQQLANLLDLDAQGYRQLQALLEAQRSAALAHRAATMEQLAGEIVAAVEAIEARGTQRDVALRRLAPRGESPRLRTLVQRLPATIPAALRDRLAGVMHQLEQLSVDCKRLNLRNCELIHEQHDLMQSLLGAAGPIYAQP